MVGSPSRLDDHYEWLIHAGSLTAQLRARCGDFAVRVWRQGLARPSRDEAIALGVPRHELAWIREVVLCAGASPLLFARSVVPRGHVAGAWNLFSRLGARPLGELLFSDRRIVRDALWAIRVRERDPLALRAGTVGVDPDGRARWARRSIFRRGGRRLLVSELLLPALIDTGSPAVAGADSQPPLAWPAPLALSCGGESIRGLT